MKIFTCLSLAYCLLKRNKRALSNFRTYEKKPFKASIKEDRAKCPMRIIWYSFDRVCRVIIPSAKKPYPDCMFLSCHVCVLE